MLASFPAAFVDLVMLPEAHIDAASERASKSYIRTQHGPKIAVRVAPTSKFASAMVMTLGAIPAAASTHGGIMMLMSETLATCLEGVPDHFHYESGRHFD